MLFAKGTKSRKLHEKWKEFVINIGWAGSFGCLSTEKSKMEEWRRMIVKDYILHVFNKEFRDL